MTEMTRKWAEEILKGKPDESLPLYLPRGFHQIAEGMKAKGYLEADSQWRERVKPLIEALQKIEKGSGISAYTAACALSSFKISAFEEEDEKS